MPKTTKTKEEDSEVHIAILEPENVRRYVLESAKDTIKFMQREEGIEDLRQQKLQLLVEMRGLLKEIASLNNRLERVMPKLRINKPELKRQFAREESLIQEYEQGTGAMARSRLDVLEDELDEIESRIKSLK